MAIIQPNLTDSFNIRLKNSSSSYENLTIQQIKNLVISKSSSFKYFILTPSSNRGVYNITTQNSSYTITDVDIAYFADNTYLNYSGNYQDVLGISPNFRTNSGNTQIVWYYDSTNNTLWSNTSIYWPTNRKEVDNINYYIYVSETSSTPLIIYYWGTGIVKINGQLPVVYTWQSVKSLKGINDFSISLPILSNINNGDPVSGASSSAFTKAPSAENNIKNLVDITLEPVATDSSATIFYTIPSGNYTSIKLYGRVGETPKCDDTDDVVQTLDQNETQISVTNLECGEYYFCIETINSENVKQYSSVETVDLSFNWDGSETTILWSGNSNKMTAQINGFGGDEMVHFIMYSGNTEIYDFWSFAAIWDSEFTEASIAELAKSVNVGFIIDTGRQLAKPSCVYYICNPHDPDYQKYTYNTETYMSDAQMQAVYNWLLPGM